MVPFVVYHTYGPFYYILKHIHPTYQAHFHAVTSPQGHILTVIYYMDSLIFGITTLLFIFSLICKHIYVHLIDLLLPYSLRIQINQILK